MILFNRGTIPWSSYVIFELVSIDEYQWTQKRDENYQWEVYDSEKTVHLEYRISEHKCGNKSGDVVDKSHTVSQNMPEHWDETKDTKRNVQETKYLWVLVKTTWKQNRGEEDSVDTGWFPEDHTVVLWNLSYAVLFLGLLLLLEWLIGINIACVVSLHLLSLLLGLHLWSSALVLSWSYSELWFLIDQIKIIVD